MSLQTFINGQFLPAQDATLKVGDLAIQRGYGIFDFFKTVEGVPIFIEDYLNRFFRSAKEMHLQVPYSRAELIQHVNGLMERNQIPNSGIRLTLTGGYSADAYTVSSPNLIITQQPLLIREKPTTGIHVLSCEHQRQVPEVKTIDYLMAIKSAPLLQQQQADDLLYCQQGNVTECPRANLFMVTEDNKLVTPDAHILAGITRSKILELAEENGVIIERRTVRLDEVKNAKEVFITSTTKNILPVFYIDHKPIGEAKIGDLTSKMILLLHDLIAQVYTTSD